MKPYTPERQRPGSRPSNLKIALRAVSVTLLFILFVVVFPCMFVSGTINPTEFSQGLKEVIAVFSGMAFFLCSIFIAGTLLNWGD